LVAVKDRSAEVERASSPVKNSDTDPVDDAAAIAVVAASLPRF
jgi:hypothetical protein